MQSIHTIYWTTPYGTIVLFEDLEKNLADLLRYCRRTENAKIPADYLNVKITENFKLRIQKSTDMSTNMLSDGYIVNNYGFTYRIMFLITNDNTIEIVAPPDNSIRFDTACDGLGLNRKQSNFLDKVLFYLSFYVEVPREMLRKKIQSERDVEEASIFSIVGDNSAGRITQFLKRSLRIF